MSSDPTVLRVLALVKRFGREATSFQALEPGLKYWFDGDEACVPYSEVRGAWVSAGEPLCDAARLREVSANFVDAARQVGRRARFFHVSEAFCQATGLRRTHIGEMPIWDPQDWRGVRAS